MVLQYIPKATSAPPRAGTTGILFRIFQSDTQLQFTCDGARWGATPRGVKTNEITSHPISLAERTRFVNLIAESWRAWISMWAVLGYALINQGIVKG